MALEKDFDLLDDYLGNRMDEPGRRAFEQKLNSDPSLKAELDFQQQMISSIKNVRMMELKSMLNNVAVPVAHSGATVATKVTAWVVAIGLVATGLYLYLDQEEVSSQGKKENSVVTEPKSKEPKEDSTVPQPVDSSHDDSPVVSSEPAASEQKPVAPKPVGKKEPTSKNPKIEVYDPTEEEQQEEQQAEQDVDMGQVSEAPTVAVEIERDNKKYNFHYRFKDGKLFLFGPFEQNVYEIMEFFSEQKRTLFLYYNEQFYLLKDNSTSLKPLAPIQDAELVKKLKEYRNK